YALSSAYEQDWQAQGFSQGWTDRLGVRPEWRGRGIASALLYRSMQSFRAAGLDAAGLGVDADDEKGAVRLYEQLGYRPVSMFVTYVHDEAR
ncbi:MAG: family N-acetyltransferase, partial [Friedmanniella sp.]|nr:family N-acetyltransferase [Friedmanniella sp.]